MLSTFLLLLTTCTTGGQYFEADGVRLWYCVAGKKTDAPPVVFLHGGPGQGAHHLAALAGEQLEKEMQIVYYDQRASGRSSKSADGKYSLAQLVDDIEALRKELKAPRIVVFGQSFGGVLALEYAAKYPEHTAGVVFVAGMWSIPVQCDWRVRTLQTLRPKEYDAIKSDTLDRNGRRRTGCDMEFLAFKSEHEREGYNMEAMFRDSMVSVRMDSVQRAAGLRNNRELGGALFRQGLLSYEFKEFDKLTAPTLIIAGSHDGAARPEGLQELAKRIRGSGYLEYENVGHFVYLEEPARFARDVGAFVRKLAKR